MVQKKAGRPRKKRKVPQKRPSSRGIEYVKVAGALGLLVVIVVAMFVAAHLLLRPYMTATLTVPKASESKPHVNQKSEPSKKPTYEIFPKEKKPPRKSPVKVRPGKTKSRPPVAIIIDDLGYENKIASKLLQLDATLNFAFLPFGPFQDRILQKAHAKGFDILLHLPMEPVEYPMVDPGRGALLTSMSPDELIRQLEENIESIPWVKGVNNHMGSKMTSLSSQMLQIFTILKKNELFFVDSRTTTETLSRPSARLLQVAFAERDIFLDHYQETGFIKGQIRELIQVAHDQGFAIGIGHPYPVTHEVLRKMLPELKKSVTLVPISSLVKQIG